MTLRWQTGKPPRDEIWRPIFGYEHKYEISSAGRVKSLCMKGTNSSIILKTRKDKDGYPIVNLGLNNTKRVHRLVCVTFHGIKPNGMEVAHIDGNKQNNNAENLMWATRKENERQSYRQGTRVLGERSPLAKLNRYQVLAIRASNLSTRKLSKAYSCSRGAICAILSRRSWAWLEPPKEPAEGGDDAK